MLPTTGFFKNIDCPFYESSCERPYCHFKHRKKTQEPTEIINAVPLEVPTYNPTPKSQLANAKSHIPISYVPDLAVRTERNFRSLSSSYGYSGGDKPTYKPTPLSILSTGKINSIKSTENINYNPTAISNEDEEIITNKFDSNVDCDDSNDINFEDLETEFDMIGELINDADVNHEVNGENKEVLKNDETTKSKHKSSSSSHKSKHNGKEKESTSSKSKSDDKKSKHSSHSSSNKKRSSSSSSSRSESKSSNDKKESKPSKSNSKDDGKRSRSKERKKESSKSESSRDKKHESKDKHKHHKESSRHSHKSKTKERDKERKSEDKKKHKVSSKSDDKFKEKPEEKLDTNSDESNNDECDLLNFDNEDSDVEEDTLEECYKIFTEYKPTEPELFPELKKQETNLDENSVILNFNRKRIAHENADKMKSSKVLFNKPKYVPSAAQMMVNRLKAARLAHASNEQDDIMTEINKHIFKRPSETVLNDNNTKVLKTSRISTKPVVTKLVISKPSTSSSLIDDIISGKSTTSKPRRIAPVQNVDSIQRAKAKLQEMAKMRAINATKTVCQSVTKGVKRTAHVPEYSVADVPDVLEAERSKLPVNVRSRYLTMILDECVKLYLSKEEAQQRALNEEYKCYERCAALVTYRNSTMLAVNRLRKELQEREIQGLGPIFPGEVSDSSKSSTSDLHGRKFYKNIKRFILTDEELVLHGFPREGTLPGQAIIKNQKHVSKGYLGENDRSCCRCLKLYKVDEQGFAIYEEECLYHPLKKRTFRGESIYLCCRSSEDTGCVTAATHVCESIIMNDGEIEGYQTTMPPDRDDDSRSYEVFALDCEMCYTTKGLELTRVTIVNSELKTVYETLVKPLNTIIDYNTRFSGITEEQMNRTATSILQVQANILHLCNSNTILIGHSLESDMKALKIIHNTIVDTSVLFPHKFGLPHKRALRDLAREYLKKIIQNDISGHDSAEDALTCMELVQWKVKEELKTRGIKV